MSIPIGDLGDAFRFKTNGTRRSRGIRVRMCLAFWVVLAFLSAAFARERGPRVEVICPTPPIQSEWANSRCLCMSLTSLTMTSCR